MPQILKLAPEAASEDRELDFEPAWQRSFSTAQRFEMMIARSRQIAQGPDPAWTSRAFSNR